MTVNLDAKTVIVDSYDPVPIESAKDIVEFSAVGTTTSSYGVSSGEINRISGAASVRINTEGGLLVYSGTCKRGQRLF
jgi:hypothetical protein